LAWLASPDDPRSIGPLFLGVGAAAMKKNAPALTVPQVHLLLMGLLPKRHVDPAWAWEVVMSHQQRNHAAYLSHRKRRLTPLNQ
jgi:hypothetical protein